MECYMFIPSSTAFQRACTNSNSKKWKYVQKKSGFSSNSKKLIKAPSDEDWLLNKRSNSSNHGGCLKILSKRCELSSNEPVHLDL